MTTYPCACSRGSSPTPGVPCASCLARRTPRALPPLAPFAVEHILQDAAERSDATIQAEALKAANAQ